MEDDPPSWLAVHVATIKGGREKERGAWSGEATRSRPMVLR